MTDKAKEWDLARINALIAGGIEERSDLEFKGARALDRKDVKKKNEIVKDVSAMANSAGGVIIYGVAEATDSTGAPYAERLDPIDRSCFSSDTLDQIIQSVQPKIDGVVITPVDMPDAPEHAVYVVTVPQSSTAHQAKDKKYHRRRNTTTDAMDDYEVRDVMNRSKHPKIRVSFEFNTFPEEIGMRICVHNDGSVTANHVRAFICMPMCLGIRIRECEGRPDFDLKASTTEYCWKNLHYDFVGKSLASEATHSVHAGTKRIEDCYVTRDSPILPNTSQTSTHGLSLRPENIDDLKGKVIAWEAYADNAPAEVGKLDLSKVYTQIEKYYSNL